MAIAYWFLLSGFSAFVLFSIYQLFRIFKKSHLKDFSIPKGNNAAAVLYALTGAMSPLKKETATLHLPTYASGILFHLASFASFLWVALHLSGLRIPPICKTLTLILLFVGVLSGLLLLLKRVFVLKLRQISSPDDYTSNLAVTGFQVVSALTLMDASLKPILFYWTGFLFFYMQVGKLRHVLFFFIARLYLGLFFGRRGVWPLNRRKAWIKRIQ